MIKVLLFAGLQEEVGKDRLEFDVDSISVEDLKQELQSIYHLTGLESAMTAINEEYALNTDTAAKGDTVAFIPPVSGG